MHRLALANKIKAETYLGNLNKVEAQRRIHRRDIRVMEFLKEVVHSR